MAAYSDHVPRTADVFAGLTILKSLTRPSDSLRLSFPASRLNVGESARGAFIPETLRQNSRHGLGDSQTKGQSQVLRIAVFSTGLAEVDRLPCFQVFFGMQINWCCILCVYFLGYQLHLPRFSEAHKYMIALRLLKNLACNYIYCCSFSLMNLPSKPTFSSNYKAHTPSYH